MFYYPFTVRKSTVAFGDNRAAGLASSATVVQLLSVAAAPQAITTTDVSVVEVGNGVYYVAYDPEAHGDAVVQLDMDPTGLVLTSGNDRYQDVALTRESPYLLKALPDVAPGAVGGLPTVGTGNVLTQGVAVASYAPGADPATALAAVGITAARMAFLDASLGNWSRAGNVITMTTLDGLTSFSLTLSPDITNPTAGAVVQLS